MTELPALYPLFAKVQGRQVLVVGGGAVAERKVQALLNARADVRVGAPRLTPQLKAWAEQARIGWRPGTFEPFWVDGAWLVIAATDDQQINADVCALCDARRIWVNVVDNPQLSSFHVPAVVDRRPVSIAISSGGAAPMVARRIREQIETLFDAGLGSLAALLGRYRQQIVAAYPDLGARREFYDRLYEGPIQDLLRQGRADAAQALLERQLEQAAPSLHKAVSVLLLRADEPGSMTLDGLRALNTADVLVSEQDETLDILDMARRDADRSVFQADAWSCDEAVLKALKNLLGRHRQVVVILRHEEMLGRVESASRQLEAEGVSYRRLESGRRL